MTSLTKNSPRTRIGIGQRFGNPVAAGVRIYSGALVALDADGNAIPATPAAPNMRGVALQEADNSAGAAGAIGVETDRGAFLIANDGTVTRAMISGPVYVVDDNTVGATGTLVAGKCLDVSSEGVTVEIL